MGKWRRFVVCCFIRNVSTFIMVFLKAWRDYGGGYYTRFDDNKVQIFIVKSLLYTLSMKYHCNQPENMAIIFNNFFLLNVWKEEKLKVSCIYRWKIKLTKSYLILLFQVSNLLSLSYSLHAYIYFHGM